MNRSWTERLPDCIAPACAALATVASLALVFLHLGFAGLWVDEIYTLNAISLPWREMVLERLMRGHLPLYFLLLRGCVAAGGGVPSELLLRLPSALAWAGALAAFWPLALRFLGRPRAYLAIVLFALNGVAVRQAAEARMYALVLLFAVGTLHAYLAAVSGDGRTRWRVLFFAFTLLTFFTTPTAFLVNWVYLWDAWKRRKANGTLIWMVLAPMVAALLTLIPGVLAHSSTKKQGEIAHVPPMNLLGHLATFLTGVPSRDDYFDFGPALSILQGFGVVLAFALLGLLFRSRAVLSPTQGATARLTLLPILVMGLTWALEEATGRQVSVMGPPRYLIATIPAGAILTASLLDPVLQTARGPRRLGAAAVLLTAILAAGSFLILRVPTEGTRFRALVGDYLKRQVRPGDGLVVVPAQVAAAVRLYLPGVPVDVAIDRFERDPARIADMLRPMQARPTVWMVLYRGLVTGAPTIAEKVLGPFDWELGNRSLGKLRVLKYIPGRTDNPTSKPVSR